jgi:hypothetical protein
MKIPTILSNIRRQLFPARAVLACCLLLCASAASLVAQSPDDNIYGDRPNNNTARNNNPDNNRPANDSNYDANNTANNNANSGVSAGGNWHQIDSEDKMTAAKRIKFELLSNNALRGSRDRESQSRVEIYCENGKYKTSDFVPGIRLAQPNRPGFWGQPQMEVMVRVDGSHSNHGWNWEGHYLSMDKGTTRELLGAQVFNIEFLSPGGPQISEFTPTGIELSRIQKACGLTPKKP